ncbi:hypothetical protein KKG41_00755 [Patescibacteria group bacterium]|nr:hypothetical protein [Patescibacteria group bacterium]MBU1891004.1 hypothetical protein [Patescibacteria group bacterium]
MYEDAQKILSYLPIRKNKAENDYIEHLWRAFSELDASESSAHPFCIMPFHLLFMLAVQYKILRVSQIHTESCNLFFCGVAGRCKNELLSEQKSVFDIALINERTIPEIFQLVGLGNGVIKSIKDLIDERNNNLAHAKGGIEQKIEEKVDLYLQAVENIQQKFKSHNEQMTHSWLEEITEGDNFDQLLENRFLDLSIAPNDFGDIVGILLGAEQLDFDQWTQAVNKGLEFTYDKTIPALHELAKNETDDSKRFNAIKILQENGEIDDEMKKSIIESEKDEEILELLGE